MLLSISITGTPGLRLFLIASKQALSASGSQKLPPSLSSIETPLRGSRMAIGAVAALAAAAIISPILVFSSALVRSRVTLGFHS